MRMLLSKLGVVDYLGLVAASSIIRPGVAQSGMMRQYILLHRHPEKRSVQHPVMLDIMPETYGVMVYQEDVIKVAHYFAGLTLGEADVLRRGMSGKSRSKDEFTRVRDKFFSNCLERGYSDQLSTEIWRQIESFAGYSFAKGHSASFAVESFQSLYLKAHYPLEFMVGVINNFGGFYHTEFYFHEARMAGAQIEAPCINQSRYLSSIKGKVIHIGFIHISGLEQKVAEHILGERHEGGPYTDLDNFLYRVPLGLEQVVLLIRVGAFRFTSHTKQSLLWKAHFILNKSQKMIPSHELFYHRRAKDFELPPFDYNEKEDLLDELDLLGFTLKPAFDLLAEKDTGGIPAREIQKHKGKTILMVGQLVTIKPTRTIKGESMYFGTFLDREGHWIDTVHFPPVAKKYPFRKGGCYQLIGKITEEFGFYSMEVQSMEKLGYWNREDG
jgi:DNA polymerase-3 subunit alpha